VPSRSGASSSDLVEEDSALVRAFRATGRMSQRTPEEVAARSQAMNGAAGNAARVPVRTPRLAFTRSSWPSRSRRRAT